MSRLTDDWVTSQPSAASASARSSWVWIARVLISSRILRCRFRRSAVIGATFLPASRADRADRTGAARARPTGVTPREPARRRRARGRRGRRWIAAVRRCAPRSAPRTSRLARVAAATSRYAVRNGRPCSTRRITSSVASAPPSSAAAQRAPIHAQPRHRARPAPRASPRCGRARGCSGSLSSWKSR